MYEKITISGKICTGKSTLFHSLGAALGWPSFSVSQYFRDYARTHEASLEKAEEQNPNLTRDVDLGTRKKLQESPHIIIEGWMTGLMAEGIPSVLRILLTCEDTVRIARFADRDGVSMDEARIKVLAREKNLFDKLEQIYHRADFVDPAKYDLVIDTTHQSAEETLQHALAALQSSVHPV